MKEILNFIYNNKKAKKIVNQKAKQAKLEKELQYLSQQDEVTRLQEIYKDKIYILKWD